MQLRVEQRVTQSTENDGDTYVTTSVSFEFEDINTQLDDVSFIIDVLKDTMPEEIKHLQ